MGGQGVLKTKKLDVFQFFYPLKNIFQLVLYKATIPILTHYVGLG